MFTDADMAMAMDSDTENFRDFIDPKFLKILYVWFKLTHRTMGNKENYIDLGLLKRIYIVFKRQSQTQKEYNAEKVKK